MEWPTHLPIVGGGGVTTRESKEEGVKERKEVQRARAMKKELERKQSGEEQ